MGGAVRVAGRFGAGLILPVKVLKMPSRLSIDEAVRQGSLRQINKCGVSGRRSDPAAVGWSLFQRR